MISPKAAVSNAMTRGLLAAAAATLLAGCISLFPTTDPAQLYRFGTTAPQVQGTASGGPGFGVFLAVIGFDRAAAGDRILTVTGTQAAYIKGARWVTSSASLFDSALQHAFDADRGPARLVDRGEIGPDRLCAQARRADVRGSLRQWPGRHPDDSGGGTCSIGSHTRPDRGGRPKLQGFRHRQRQSRGRHRPGVRPGRRQGPGRVGGMGGRARGRLSVPASPGFGTTSAAGKHILCQNPCAWRSHAVAANHSRSVE